MNKIKKQQMAYGKKKHCTQMNELEKDFLMRQFRKVAKKDWTFTNYSLGKFNVRDIDPNHFMTIFDADSEVIEYHKKDGSNRILLRGKRIHNGAQICAVFAPEQKIIVTLYLNYHENRHENLKIEFYDPQLDVLKLYKEGKQ